MSRLKCTPLSNQPREIPFFKNSSKVSRSIRLFGGIGGGPYPDFGGVFDSSSTVLETGRLVFEPQEDSMAKGSLSRSRFAMTN